VLGYLGLGSSVLLDAQTEQREEYS